MVVDEDSPSVPRHEEDVREFARRLVGAFGSGDLPTYFGCFADDATFVFHTHPEVLTSVQAYRRLWERWLLEDDFTVLACTSSEAHWQVGDEAAVLVHRVATTVRTAGEEATLDERETIVFRRSGQGWRAVHEHLSAHPGASTADAGIP